MTTTSRSDKRYRVPLRELNVALKDIKVEVELGYDQQLALQEAERCLNCDVQTVFATPLCIECDACVDICPMDCITLHRQCRRGRRCATGCMCRRSIAARICTSPRR